VQGDDLPTLKFGQRREEGLEHAPDSVSETRDKVVEYKLWMMGRCSRVALLSRLYLIWQDTVRRRRTKIFLVSSIELSLKYAVGPSGKCTSVIASVQQSQLSVKSSQG
jgi:hypothetical protein